VTTVIRCTDLQKRFGPTIAVNYVDLEVEQGEIISLVGPSGCGKTTTLRLIAGFEVPDLGTIEIGGQVVADGRQCMPPERRRIGMVFQDYALFPHMSVEQNVAFGLARMPSNERKGAINHALDLVGLQDLAGRQPHQLSGGQQQRIALARALAPRPAVILLDEPFSSIDAALRARVRTDVRQILKQAGATAIFVTHDQEEALSIADRVAVMWAGRLLQLDTPERIYRFPATREVAQFVGGMASIPGEVRDGRATCELGHLVCASEIAGTVEIFIRPESVLLTPSEAGEATIVRREFFGHDRRYVAALRSGRHIGSWTGIDVDLEVGQKVRVEVQDPVVAFPFASSPAPSETAELLSPFS